MFSALVYHSVDSLSLFTCSHFFKGSCFTADGLNSSLYADELLWIYTNSSRKHELSRVCSDRSAPEWWAVHSHRIRVFKIKTLLQRGLFFWSLFIMLLIWHLTFFLWTDLKYWSSSESWTAEGGRMEKIDFNMKVSWRRRCGHVLKRTGAFVWNGWKANLQTIVWLHYALKNIVYFAGEWNML